MVLYYWGIVVDQKQIAAQLEVTPGAGVPASRIKRLSSPEIHVVYDIGEWEILLEWLDKRVPLIASIQAGELTYWQGEQFQHAVVIVGYDTTQVWLIDPAAQPTLIAVTIDEFMLAWGEMDCRYSILERLP
jgi:hypothetical protein